MTPFNGGKKLKKFIFIILLLLGGAKRAINAMYIPSDNLLYRLNGLNHYLRMREKYGIDVPLIILDGEKAPQHYTEAMIKKDLQQAASLLAKKNFLRLRIKIFPYKKVSL